VIGLFAVPYCKIGNTCARTCCRCTYAVYADTNSATTPTNVATAVSYRAVLRSLIRGIVVQKKRAAHRWTALLHFRN